MSTPVVLPRAEALEMLAENILLGEDVLVENDDGTVMPWQELLKAQPDGRGMPVQVPDPPPENVSTQDPPIHARRAEDWQQEPKHLAWQQVHCRECNHPMWCRLPAKHDICEDCGWLLREQMQQQAQQQIKRVGDRFINPFFGSDYSGQSASLPEKK